MLVVDGQNFDVRAALEQGIGFVSEMLKLGFDAAPALMLGLAVFVALPFLIVGGVVLRRVTPNPDRTTKLHEERPDVKRDEDRGEGEAVRAYSDARIVVESDEASAESGPGEFQFGRAMVVRIGREEDNEIRLSHPTVHRYHAMIRRSFEEGYAISDLSDEGGNGVFVNGEKVLNAPLVDGDEITLGAARLRFGVAE